MFTSLVSAFQSSARVAFRNLTNPLKPLSEKAKFIRKIHAIVLPLLLVLVGTAWSQGDGIYGIYPFSTQMVGLYDSVDIATANIALRIPIRAKTGKIPFSQTLLGYSRLVYGPSRYSGGTYGWQGTADWLTTTGFSDQSTFASGVATGYTCNDQQTGYVNVSEQVYRNWAVADALGLHPLSSYYNGSVGVGTLLGTDKYGCFATPAMAMTTDGSGYTFLFDTYNTGRVFDRSGNLVSGLSIVDPDGSSMSLTSVPNANGGGVIDTLGAVAIEYPNASPLPQIEEYTDAAGNFQSYTVNYSSQFTLLTNFGCGFPDIAPGQVGAALPTSISTPIGQFTISYEVPVGYSGNGPYGPYTTSRIAMLKSPLGASVAYTYSGGGNNGGLDCNSQEVPVLTRTLTDSAGHSSTWTYVNSNHTFQAGGVNNFTNFTVTETDPANNQTVYNFTGDTQTQVQYYQGTASGTPLKTVSSGGGIGNSTAPPSAPWFQTDQYTSLNGGPPSLVETISDLYMNPIEVKQYDFGATTPPSGTPISDTTMSYGQSWNGTSCNPYPSGVYIRNTPCYIHTVNSSGVDSITKITYNNAGHAVSTARWTGSTWLTSTATYNSNGTVETATDVNGAVSTYAYNGTGGCNNILPTSVTVTGAGMPLVTSTQWDCNGGVPTKTFDANTQPSQVNYVVNNVADPFYRPLSAVDSLTNTTNFSYTGTTAESALNFNGSVSTSDKLTTTDGLGRQLFSQARQGQAPSVTTFDSTQTTYGWKSASSGACTTQPPFTFGACTTQSVPYSGTQSQPAPSGTAVTTTQYDAVGRPLTVTDGGGGTTTYTYTQNDVLVTTGPAPSGENLKKKQLEYDGLGRLTSVCELTSAANGGVTCGQKTTQTGYWTRYKYDALGHLIGVCQNTTQPLTVDCVLNPSAGQQTRTYTYDGLGRLTSEKNPESGTTTYIYDSNSSGFCSPNNSAGDLLLKTDANGNSICYIYDDLHRVTDVGNTSQSTTNYCKRFRYDSVSNSIASQPTGYPSQSYVAGRLVEAETDTCALPVGSSMITDEWFSYDKDGNITDMWESTPHSGQYYHSKATFYANGQVNTLQLASPSLYTMSWGLDGEGRPKTLTDTTSNTSLVTGATYWPSVNPAVVNLTGSDKDTYTYDANTGHMTKYVFNVGSSSMTGILNWNANSTLNQLAITDGFNSGGTQTCNYNSANAANTGYDDLGRLIGFDCGTGQWGQTFSYDPFGNLTKTKMSNRNGTTWSPGYNESNNHCNGCSYDMDGNVESDGNNVYGWNVYSKLAWTATSGTPTCGTSGRCITYDAFGRAVEQSNNATFIERWITPIGETAYMSGASSNYAYWPAPGGGTVVILGTNNYDYFHKDWLGNARITSGLSNHVPGTDQAYSPFGELYDIFGSGAAEFETFAGLTGDFDPSTTTPVMWDTPNRELSMVGRWLSPDPAGLGAVNSSNPQSWNRYTYALNNPLSVVDPTGLWCVWEDNTHDDDPKYGGASKDVCWSQGGHWDPTDTITGIVADENGNVTRINGVDVTGITLQDFDQTLFGMNWILNGGCVQPTKVQQALISVLGTAAKALKKTFGVGHGGSAGVGALMGTSINYSNQLVVSPNGQAAFVETTSDPSAYPFNAILTGGAGGMYGTQISVSNAQTPDDIGGPFLDFGGMSGDLVAGGVDYAAGAGTQGQYVYQYTGTFGVGYGGRGAAGTPTLSSVISICQ